MKGEREGKVIVCESTGAWGIGLRRVLRSSSWEIIQTRNPSDCFARLSQHPISIVAWEGTTEEADALVGYLLRQNRWFPGTSAVVLCNRSAARFFSLWREAGAIHVVRSPRELGRVRVIAERHPLPAPAQNQPLEETIWQELPWSRFGVEKH